MLCVDVPLGDRSYPVHVGPGARHMLNDVISNGVRRVAIITQESIPWTVECDIENRTFTIPDGEAAKSMATAETLCSGLARWGMTRSDLVVGVGGGVVTDLSGFVAAIYHRGIRFVTVPTSLLGQIDAAIGGKTGVNLPEGKNLVGAFWQPTAVLADTETLSTLPPRELASGNGEMAKYHFLGRDDLDSLDLDARIAACVQIKADVVAADEREGGRRAVLNYGHTLAHALETAGEYDLRHGEAVAVGLVYAAEVAHRLGRIDAERLRYHRQVVAGYDLAMKVPPRFDTDELVDLFARDKKAIDGITLILDGADGVESVTGIDRKILTDAVDALR